MRTKKVGSRQKAEGRLVVKKTPGGKFTFKLSNVYAAILYHAIQHGFPGHSPKTAPMVIHACAWYCVGEVFNKTLWQDKQVKISLTKAQACAMIYVMIPYDQPFIIDLKAQLLKAL